MMLSDLCVGLFAAFAIWIVADWLLESRWE